MVVVVGYDDDDEVLSVAAAAVENESELMSREPSEEMVDQFDAREDRRNNFSLFEFTNQLREFGNVL